MIIFFFLYILFHYLFISKKIFNICTISLFYILAGIVVGEMTVEYSSKWVSLFDKSYSITAVFYLKTVFFILLATITILQIIFPEHKLKKSNRINLEKLISANSSWLLIILLAIPLYIVFLQIYVPLFEPKTFISKYFQDRLPEFIPYRPFYTLALNGLSTILFLQLNYFLLNVRKITIFNFFLNKKFMKLFFLISTLLLTAKRGQLFLPVFISMISFMIYKRKIILLSVFGVFSVVLIGLSRNFNKVISGNIQLEDIYMSLSTSFFVSVREFSRVISAFQGGNHEYLYGKTYVAGFFSFIPTTINKLKANYNYMRYSSIISNQDPDQFGGMRSTFAGEAMVNFGYIGIICCSVIFGFVIYFLYLLIKKYSNNVFVFFIVTLWSLKLIVLPFYENGSAMLLFFQITIIFMIIPSFKILFNKGRLIMKIGFLNKKQ